MYVADSKRLTHQGAKMMVDAAVAKARVRRDRDLLRRGRRRRASHCVRAHGRRAFSYACIPRPPRRCAPRRTSGHHGQGRGRADLDTKHALGLALAAGPERWTAMEGGSRSSSSGECIGGIGVSGGNWATDERIAREAVEAIGASCDSNTSQVGKEGVTMRTAARRLYRHGLVVGRAGRRHGAFGQARRSPPATPARPTSAQAFAAKYSCRPVASYEEMLADRSIEAIINTTPNDVHLETTLAAAAAGKHVFLDKPIANTVADGARDHARRAARPASCWRSAISAARKAISAGCGGRSTPARSAGSSTPKPTSAATGWARSISRHGAIRPPACRAA